MYFTDRSLVSMSKYTECDYIICSVNGMATPVNDCSQYFYDTSQENGTIKIV